MTIAYEPIQHIVGSFLGIAQNLTGGTVVALSLAVAESPRGPCRPAAATCFVLSVRRDKQETATCILQYERCCCLLILIKVTGCERSYKRHPLLNKRSPL